MRSNRYLKSKWDYLDIKVLFSIFTVPWEQMMLNIDAIAEQRHQQVSEIKKLFYYEYEQLIKIINDRNEEKRKQEEKQNQQQQASMPSMGSFNMNGLMSQAKNLMKR